MSYLVPRPAVQQLLLCCWALIKYIRNLIQHSAVFFSRTEKLLAIIIVDFEVTVQLLIVYSIFVKYLGKKMGIKRGSASAIY